MRILISNDDGVMAPGIRTLAKALASIATVDVIAPDRNRSGASNSLTLANPVRVKQLDDGFYSVEGTPTDCVHLALTGFFSDTYDLVVSGINEGVNLGDDILYSGTVAAAMEGRNLGLPALAVSLDCNQGLYYETAAEITKELVLKLYTNPLPARTLLNVNVPDLPLSQIKGTQVTRLGTRHQAEPMIKATDPRGRPVYWVGCAGPEADAGPGTDFFALSEHCVSITPLHLDLTHYQVFEQVSQWSQGFSWLKTD
jgi:5'-nucleotidase